MHWRLRTPYPHARSGGIQGARDGRHHPFANEVHGLLASLKTAASQTVYSRPGPEDRLGHQYDFEGRVDISLLQRLGAPLEADFYVCGPTGFIDQLTSGLRLWGVPASRIHTEVFGPGASLTPGVVSSGHRTPHGPSGDPGAGPNVTFTRSGLVVPWSARFGSLLEFAEACDVPVKWSCRAGVCHTCESPLIEGRLRYSPEPLDQPARGNALICCSTPRFGD